MLPEEVWCGGSLQSSQGSIPGLYPVGTRGALGGVAPGAPWGWAWLGNLAGGLQRSRGGRKRDRRNPCVWQSMSASFYSQILHFLGYLNLQNGCKKQMDYFLSVLFLIMAREIPVSTESSFCGAVEGDALSDARENKSLRETRLHCTPLSLQFFC